MTNSISRIPFASCPEAVQNATAAHPGAVLFLASSACGPEAPACPGPTSCVGGASRSCSCGEKQRNNVGHGSLNPSPGKTKHKKYNLQTIEGICKIGSPWPRPTNFVNRFACWWITSKSNPLDEATQPEIHLLHQRVSKVISNLNAG